MSETVKQTTRASAVLSVVLQDLASVNRFEHVVKRDVFLHHFLVSVLGKANILCSNLSTYPFQNVSCIPAFDFSHAMNKVFLVTLMPRGCAPDSLG